MKLQELNNLFTEDCQYMRLYDLSNDSEVCFEGQICEMPVEYYKRKIILIETITETEFDGYLGIYIATKGENEYYKIYNEEE